MLTVHCLMYMVKVFDSIVQLSDQDSSLDYELQYAMPSVVKPDCNVETAIFELEKNQT